MGWGEDGYVDANTAVAYGTRTAAGKGYNLFATQEVVDVNLILGGETDTGTNGNLAGMVGQGATERNDAMVFLSPSYANAVTTPSASAIVTGKNTTNNYVVVDGAWKYQYDRYRDIFMWLPMNGDTAGLCARTEHTDDAWWSPAGMLSLIHI